MKKITILILTTLIFVVVTSCGSSTSGNKRESTSGNKRERAQATNFVELERTLTSSELQQWNRIQAQRSEYFQYYQKSDYTQVEPYNSYAENTVRPFLKKIGATTLANSTLIITKEEAQADRNRNSKLIREGFDRASKEYQKNHYEGTITIE